MATLCPKRFPISLRSHYMEPIYLPITFYDSIKPFALSRNDDTHKGNYGHLLVVGTIAKL